MDPHRSEVVDVFTPATALPPENSGRTPHAMKTLADHGSTENEDEDESSIDEDEEDGAKVEEAETLQSEKPFMSVRTLSADEPIAYELDHTESEAARAAMG